MIRAGAAIERGMTRQVDSSISGAFKYLQMSFQSAFAEPIRGARFLLQDLKGFVRARWSSKCTPTLLTRSSFFATVIPREAFSLSTFFARRQVTVSRFTAPVRIQPRRYTR